MTSHKSANPFTRDHRSMRDRMLAGDPYITENADIARLQRFAQQQTETYKRLFTETPAEAQAILADLLGALGADAAIRPPLFVDYGSNLFVGARTFINYGLQAADVAPIRIGEDCQLGPNVQLLTPTHPLAASPRRDKWEGAQPITLGNNVWLGGGVIVCPGVTIGDNTVVGAGAVVTKDLPAGVVAVGNPARVIKELPPDPAGYAPPGPPPA